MRPNQIDCPSNIDFAGMGKKGKHRLHRIDYKKLSTLKATKLAALSFSVSFSGYETWP